MITYLLGKMADGGLAVCWLCVLPLRAGFARFGDWVSTVSHSHGKVESPNRRHGTHAFPTTEVGVALFGSVVMSVVVYYGIKLQGSLVVFWMVYFSTICAGIGERPVLERPRACP